MRVADERRNDPTGGVRRLYEEAESRTARAFEEAVSRESFGELLAKMTENVVGMTKIGTDIFDLMLRNLRLAGRQDVARLARQLNRAEDKLELLLQEIEELQDELDRGGREAEPPREVPGAGTTGGSRSDRAPNGSRTTAGRRGRAAT
jgi:hypothetical protein